MVLAPGPSRRRPGARRGSFDASPTAGLSFVPERQEGSIRGFRIRGVRPGSVAEMVGLEEGDRIDDIDGHDLSRPEGALQAYSRFRNAPDVRVNITRNGEPMTLIYRFK
jgi:general secretion pathway protein C